MSPLPEHEPSLRDYARIVARRKGVVIAAVVATVAAALFVSSMQKPVYEAEAQMLVKTRSTGAFFDDGGAQYSDPVRAIQTEIRVLQSQAVSERVQANLGLSVGTGARGVSVGATDVVAVRVRSGVPETAQLLANAYVQAYIEIKREQAVGSLVSAGTELQKKVTELQGQIDDLDAQVEAAPPADRDILEANLSSQRQILLDQQALFKQQLDQLQVDAALTTGGADVVRQASLPAAPVEPTPRRTGALAAIVGILLGLAAAFLLDHLDDSIRTSEELEEASGGLPVLAVVPVDAPLDNLPIALSKPTDYAVEAYRGLRTSLQFLSLDDEVRVVQVTSPLSGEGKTTTAANLAVVFAQAGMRAILVDADLRKPRVHEVFAIDNSRGLTTALLGEPYELLTKRTLENLDVLPSGLIPPNPSELLGGRQMKQFLAKLAADYDVVVVDSAPILPVTDSVALSALVQGVLVVTQARRTSTKQLGQALSQLRRVQAPLLGSVLNKTGSKRRSGDGYGYGYGYGGYGYGGESKPSGRRRKGEGKSSSSTAKLNGHPATSNGSSDVLQKQADEVGSTTAND
jgi:non-specific protein-tyrosine kinase